MATSKILKQLISLGTVLLASVYWTLFQECYADVSWNNFALCSGYTDQRLVVPGNLFQPRLITKGSSLVWVRMDCSHSCANEGSCYAFNFYENETFYVCELLSDNLRRNRTALQLLNYPGCSVWEKLSTGMNSLTSAKSTQPTPGASTAMNQPSTATASKSITRNSQTSVKSTQPTPRASTAITQPKTLTSIKTTASLSTGVNSPTKDTTPQLCADLRWGCLGTFPDCHSCIKTCKDYMARDDLTGPPIFLWPDGDGPDSMPISVRCEMSSTVLIERHINLTSRTETVNNIMSIYDMHRLIQLNAYPHLRITLQTSFKTNVSVNSRADKSDYSNVFMTPNGTLSNLTYYSSYGATVDIFNLKGQPMKPTPFINVTDDRYSCGSFWLLDATNATYCPGGAVGMFGTLIANSTRVVNTGIRVPTIVNGLTYYAKVTLTT